DFIISRPANSLLLVVLRSGQSQGTHASRRHRRYWDKIDTSCIGAVNTEIIDFSLIARHSAFPASLTFCRTQAMRPKVNRPTIQPAGLALNTIEPPLFLDYQIIGPDMNERSQDNFSSFHEGGHHHGLGHRTDSVGIVSRIVAFQPRRVPLRHV